MIGKNSAEERSTTADDSCGPRPIRTRRFAVLAERVQGRELATTKELGWVEGIYVAEGFYPEGSSEYIHSGYYLKGFRMEWFRGDPNPDDFRCDYFRWIDPPE